MAGIAAAATDETIGNNMQKAIVSMVRFSSAFTLYGVEKLQATLSPRERQDFSSAVEEVGVTLDSLTESLNKRVDDTDQGALRSATRIVGQVVEQSWESLSLLDPRRAVRVATNLIRTSSQVLSGSSPDASSVAEDKPELAVDVLTPKAHQ